MPTYEYECTKGHHFEVQQSITEEPLKRCNQCRSKVQRLISASAFILKGDGWYADGYSSGSKKSGTGAKGSSGAGESGGDTKPAGESTAKTETKSDTKTSTTSD